MIPRESPTTECSTLHQALGFGDGKQHARAEHEGDERGAAIADEGQRHADHRQDARHHAHVDEGVDEKNQRDRRGQQAREQRGRVGGDHQPAHDEEGIGGQQHEIAGQPPLFGQHREHEVGMRFGHEVQMRLGAVQIALAEHPAGADGDHALDDVEALAQRIALRVEQHHQPLPLIVVHEVPHHRGTGGGERKQQGDDPPRQPGEEDDEGPGEQHQQRGAEVGLLHDETDGDEQQHRGDEKILHPDLALALLEVPGQHQRHGDFHDLGRLHHGDAQIEPAARALAHQPEHGRGDEQRDAKGVDRHGDLHQPLRRHLRRDEQHQKTDAQIAQMIVERHMRILQRGKQHDAADGHQPQQRRGQWRIEAGEIGAHSPPERRTAEGRTHSLTPSDSSLTSGRAPKRVNSGARKPPVQAVRG